MGPMMDAKFAERYEEFLGWVQPHHAVQAAYGRITSDNPRDGFAGDPSSGLYYHPMVVDGVRPGDRIFMEETFGPIVGVTSYQSLNEAIEMANAPGYGLSSSIYTTDPKDAFTFRDKISAGMVSINNSTSGAEAHLPFGGNGKSMGPGSPAFVLDQFTRWQAVNWDYSGRLEGPDGHCRAHSGHHLPPLELLMHPLDRHFRNSHRRVSIGGPCRPPMLTRRRGGGSSRRRRPAGTLICGAELQQQGRGFYTIGSAGHESNAMVALASRTSDPALLHYRSGRSTWLEPDRCRVDASPRHAAGTDGPGRRAHCRGPAQGFRPSRAGRYPADLHGCLPSSKSCWSGHRAATGTPAPGGLRVARGRGRGVLVRRRLREPFHRSRRDQYRPRYGLPWPAGTDSSSARTTASASRCRHRRVGSRRRMGPGQGWPTWRPTALIQRRPGRRSCKR